MKWMIPLLIFAAVACKKKDPAPQPTNPTPPTCQQPTGIKDILWRHTAGSLADLKFRSDGKYFQGQDSTRTWSFKGCDSVYVQGPANSFYYRVLKITSDSLKILNPAIGEVRYSKAQ